MKSLFMIAVIAIGIVASNNQSPTYACAVHDEPDKVIESNDTIEDRCMVEDDLWVSDNDSVDKQSNFIPCNTANCKAKCHGASYHCAHCMCHR
jgi:hypothetical protein